MEDPLDPHLLLRARAGSRTVHVRRSSFLPTALDFSATKKMFVRSRAMPLGLHRLRGSGTSRATSSVIFNALNVRTPQFARLRSTHGKALKELRRHVRHNVRIVQALRLIPRL